MRELLTWWFAETVVVGLGWGVWLAVGGAMELLADRRSRAEQEASE